MNGGVLYLFENTGTWNASYRTGWLNSHFSLSGGRFKIHFVQQDQLGLSQIGQLLRSEQFLLERVNDQ